MIADLHGTIASEVAPFNLCKVNILEKNDKY
jgi:hypothetical protein